MFGRSSNEINKIKAILYFAESVGYGNIIAILKRAWILKLERDYPTLTPEAAENLRALADVDPYDGTDLDAFMKK